MPPSGVDYASEFLNGYAPEYVCKWPKSKLLKKIEAGMRDFKEDYVEFCRWKGKKVPSIERRRYAELALLYTE